MRVIKAPDSITEIETLAVFLGGTIDNGRDWRSEVKSFLAGLSTDVTVLDPHQDKWISGVKQSKNDPILHKQVNWELDAMDWSDVIVLWFEPGSMSSVSLLELGLHVGQAGVFVYCPEGYWCKGNIDILCERHNMPIYTNKEKLFKDLAIFLNSIKK